MIFVIFLLFFSEKEIEIDGIQYKTATDGTAELKNGLNAKNKENLVIPNEISDGADTYTVTTIGVSAFSQSDISGTITFPNTITSISDMAFEHCKKLSGALDIPNSVTQIKYHAFYQCEQITELSLPEKIEIIGTNAFAYCYGLTGSLEIPKSVSEIGSGAFRGCGFDGNLTINEGVQKINNNAFYGCSKFSGSLSLPDSLILIDRYAFYQCSKFTGTLRIPGKVQTIVSQSFEQCSGFDTLIIENGVTTIENSFVGCSGFTGSLIIPDSVTRILSNAFSGCSGFNDTLYLSKNLQAIGEKSFYNCNNFIGSLVFPNNLTTIGNEAFSGCYGFNETLVIPKYFEKLGYHAFGHLNVTSIYYYGDLSGKYEIVEAFYNCKAFFVYVNETYPLDLFDNLPVVKANDIKINNIFYRIKSDGLSVKCVLRDILFDSSVISIPSHVEIDFFPYEVNEIGHYAFYQYQKVCTIELANSIKIINNFAFGFCNNLIGTLVLPENLVTIGDSAFCACDQLYGTLVIPKSVKTIGIKAFSICRGFNESLIFKGNVETIGEYAFQACHFCGSLDLPKSITSIGQYAFSYCEEFTGSLVIPDKLTEISDFSFRQCTKFDGTLTLPNSITFIGNQAFEGCRGFTGSLVLPNNLNTIRYGAFESCSGFSGSLVIPNGVTVVEGTAFRYCSGFNDLLIFQGDVSAIRDYAFSDTSFTEVRYYGTTVPSCGSSLFSSSITSVRVLPEFPGFQFGSLTANKNLSPLEIISPTINEEETPEFSSTIDDEYKPKIIVIGGIVYETIDEKNAIVVDGSKATSTKLEIQSKITDEQKNSYDVIAIGERAFYQCAFQGTLSIPSSIKIIGDYAFSQCSGLTMSLIIPSTVVSIGIGAFSECMGFSAIMISSKNIDFINESVFMNCIRLSGTLQIPDNVKGIGSYAFFGCTEISGTLNIPSEVSYIGDHAFGKCRGFTSLKLSSNLKTIGEFAFYSCAGLEGTLDLPESVETIQKSAFTSCIKLTGTLIIPNSISSIEGSVFAGCYGLTELIIPNSVKSIGPYSFSNCAGLTGTLTIPSNVNTIYTMAFSSCNNIESLQLEGEIQIIEEKAFEKMDKLNEVHYYGLNEPKCGNDIFVSTQVKYVNVGDNYNSNKFANLPIKKASMSFLETPNVAPSSDLDLITFDSSKDDSEKSYDPTLPDHQDTSHEISQIISQYLSQENSLNVNEGASLTLSQNTPIIKPPTASPNPYVPSPFFSTIYAPNKNFNHDSWGNWDNMIDDILKIIDNELNNGNPSASQKFKYKQLSSSISKYSSTSSAFVKDDINTIFKSLPSEIESLVIIQIGSMKYQYYDFTLLSSNVDVKIYTFDESLFTKGSLIFLNVNSIDIGIVGNDNNKLNSISFYSGQINVESNQPIKFNNIGFIDCDISQEGVSVESKYVLMDAASLSTISEKVFEKSIESFAFLIPDNVEKGKATIGSEGITIEADTGSGVEKTVINNKIFNQAFSLACETENIQLVLEEGIKDIKYSLNISSNSENLNVEFVGDQWNNVESANGIIIENNNKDNIKITNQPENLEIKTNEKYTPPYEEIEPMTSTTSDDEQPGEGKSDSSLSPGAIAGIAIGCLVVVVIVILLMYFLVIRKRGQNESSSVMSSDGDTSTTL